MRTKLEIVLQRRRWRVGDAEIVNSALSESGCSMSEFARRHGLKPERLRRWRSRLSQHASSLPAGPAVSVPLLPVRIGGIGAAPMASGLSPTAEAPMLDVSLGPGVVHVPQDFDPDHLRRVMAVLVSSC